MKRRKWWIVLVIIGFIYLWQMLPPAGMTNELIGTYSWEKEPNYYITVYKDGTFYYYYEKQEIYCKGHFEKVADDTYELKGKKIEPQAIVSKERRFIFIDGETEMLFKKISQIPMIVATVKELAE